MKVSKYNYILEKDDKTFWFNGLSNKYFTLNHVLSEKLKSVLKGKEGIELLSKKSYMLYENLFENNFILKDDINELNVIRENNHKAVNTKNYLLIILPTLNCNFSCWYCVQDHIDTKMDDCTMDKVKNHLKRVIEEDKIETLHIEWFGGEPFMFFDEVIKPISTYAIELCEKANIPFINTATTNGYYLTQNIHSQIQDLNFIRFQITLDGIRDLHNKIKFTGKGESAFDTVLNNINELLSNTVDIMVLLRINYTDKTLDNQIVDEVNEIINVENRCKIRVMMRKIWQEAISKENGNRANELIDEFNKTGCKKFNHDVSKGFVPCYADRKWYNAINYNGAVVKCTANNDLYSDNPPGVLQEDGSIKWQEGFLDNYYVPRFENEHCLKCKHLPVCMGNCGRYYYENNQFHCNRQLMDNSFENEILEYIKNEEI